jgi:hypothetical protein
LTATFLLRVEMVFILICTICWFCPTMYRTFIIQSKSLYRTPSVAA